MKRPTGFLIATLFAAVLIPIFPAQASTFDEWAVGEWRLWQRYTEGGGETTFTGRFRIDRLGNGYKGSIYFDVVGSWEPLTDIIITNDTMEFTRPMYQQSFSGRLLGDDLTGRYRDDLHHGEWTWRAQRFVR